MSTQVDLLDEDRPIAEQKNTNAERILKDLLKDCAYSISESNKSYERKSRKNAKR